MLEHVFDAQRAELQAGKAALVQLDALVEQAAAIGRVTDGCGTWSRGQRTGALRRLDQVAGMLAKARAHLVVAEENAPGAVGAGDRDFVATRARSSRTGLGEARREVRQAHALSTMPAVADAVGTGDVPLAHVDALARIAEQAGERARQQLTRPETQDALVQMARRQSVREFSNAAARMVAAFDPAALERSADAQRRERFFVMSRQPEGTFLKGRLDNLSAEVLRTAIAAVGLAPDEERTKAQADADALIAVAERSVAGTAGIRPRKTAADGALLPDADQDVADSRVSGVANRPTVSILVSAETFAAMQTMQERRVATPSAEVAGAADSRGRPVEPVEPVEPAMLEDGTPLAMSELARVLCDSQIGRVVLSAESIPLDLGRTQRLYTGAQRRAVIVRDRACTWNGCDVPAAYCEVHHIRWWDRDLGPTSVENGILLCSHHHHTVHRLDLAITRHVRPPTDGARPVESVRYTFSHRHGQVINAPPDQFEPEAPHPSEPEAPRRAVPVTDEQPQLELVG